MDSNEKKDLKEIEFYSNLCQAWISTRMEKDKSLLALSVGAIGLLTTLLTTSSDLTRFSFGAYLLAIVSFIICACSVLLIFHLNSECVENAIKQEGANKKGDNSCLKIFDLVVVVSFVIGLVVSLVIGFSMGLDKLEDHMAEDKKITYRVNDSFDGISDLNPADISINSFAGISGIAPVAQSGGSSDSGQASGPSQSGGGGGQGGDSGGSGGSNSSSGAE